MIEQLGTHCLLVERLSPCAVGYALQSGVIVVAGNKAEFLLVPFWILGIGWTIGRKAKNKKKKEKTTEYNKREGHSVATSRCRLSPSTCSFSYILSLTSLNLRVGVLVIGWQKNCQYNVSKHFKRCGCSK